MKNSDALLSLYREYESLLRDKGIEPKDYEESRDDKESNRLRMCRLFRNYLSHQDDAGFLDVSDSMIKFMRDKINEIKFEDDVVKKHLKTVAAGTVTDKDKCTDAMLKLNKLKSEEIVVVTASGFGIATVYDVAMKTLESKTSKMMSLKTKKNFVLSDPLRKISDCPKDKIIVCTSDGTESGKLLGVVYP